METADVVIAGGGFAGASTAYHLAVRGVRHVVLLEREATPGFHASGRNASLTFQVLADPAEARLAVEGARFIAEPPAGFCTAPLLRRSGSLLVAQSGGVAALLQSEEDARRLGLDAAMISTAEALERVPLLAGAPFDAAFWNPSDGVVDIAALLHGYLAGAERGGVRIEYQRTITAVRRAKGRVEAIETDRGTTYTRCLVNAGGAWAGEIGNLAGVGARTLVPRRRHMFQTVIDRPIDADWPFVWHNDIDVYFRPEAGGLLMSPCDATPHPAQDPQVDGALQQLLFDKLQRAFPALDSARVTRSWACLRTFARDERFVIGRDPDIDGLVWVAALGGHGMTTSAAVGRLGAAAALGDRCAELDSFSPSRLTMGGVEG